MFKPRFGGINFSLNICRAVVVGPLTFILWLWWAFTRRSYNYLISFSKSTQNSMYKKLIKSKCGSQCHSRTVTPAPILDQSTSINQVSPSHQQLQQQQQTLSSSEICPSDIIPSHIACNDSFPGPPSLVTSPVMESTTGGTTTTVATTTTTTTTTAATASTVNITPLTNIPATAAICTTEDITIGTCSQIEVHTPSSNLDDSTTCISKAKAILTCKTGTGVCNKSDSLSSEPTNEPLISCGRTCYKKNLSTKETFEPFKSLYWTSVELPKIYRIKQITRSCLNDVILAGISGTGTG